MSHPALNTLKTRDELPTTDNLVKLKHFTEDEMNTLWRNCKEQIAMFGDTTGWKYHYIFILWFLLLHPFYLSFFFFSPNLSRRRLDVCHTSTHGVALVQFWDAGLKHDACGSLKIQDAKKVTKNRHLGTITQLCRAISLQLRHVSTIGKQLVKQQYLLHMTS